MGIGAVSVRHAGAEDAGAMAGLIVQLGYEVSETEVRDRLAAMGADQGALVAEQGGEVIGCLTISMTRVLHRPKPVGRISMMVVKEGRRGGGVGRILVEAAEAELARRGCGLVEVTSNLKRERAHRFYEGLGYERTSFRFVRDLGKR